MKANKYKFDLSQFNIAVVCHDAGGAEIVSSLLRRQNIKCKYALFGPALPIFQRKIENITNQTIAAAICDADLLICGTSKPTTYELDAIALAHFRGIKSIAILDHWINYRERFLLENQLIIPDEIWVVDEVAEQLASEKLPEFKINLIENPYKEDILEELISAKQQCLNNSFGKNGKTVLYVTEPTSEHAKRKYGDYRYWGYTEKEAVKYFFENIKLIASGISKVIIRPHPSEVESKYLFALNNLNFEVIINKESELVAQIAEADIIAGCNSMAMIVGTWAKKRVICCIPPAGRGYNLPNEGIEFIRDYESTR